MEIDEEEKKMATAPTHEVRLEVEQHAHFNELEGSIDKITTHLDAAIPAERTLVHIIQAIRLDNCKFCHGYGHKVHEC